MPVFSAKHIREWDEYTIQHEAVASIDLMERAATKCVEWLLENNYSERSFSFYCGKGNNGGDGLAMARILAVRNCRVVINILEFGSKGSKDFQINLSRLHELNINIKFIQSIDHIQPVPENDILVDALLGSGLNRPVDGITAAVIHHLNQSVNEIISIDLPSGLFVDKSSKGNLVVKAQHTLTFQCMKPCLLVPENQEFIGSVHIIDIGLHKGFLSACKPDYEWIDRSYVSSIYRPRKAFAHKGDFGHALLIAGSYGKSGAAVLCSKACLRAGAGLVTAHVPASCVNILQTAIPEAMCEPDKNELINEKLGADLSKFNVIGAGPGLGTDLLTVGLIKSLFKKYRFPLVLDADALNIISEHPELLEEIPQNSILTPHPREFERLFGKSQNDFQRIKKAMDKSRELKLNIVLKGHYTFIADTDGNGYFNSTGNSGMATAGTGDVLTGMITGIVAQKYSPLHAVLMGVYWHGLAGDLAADINSQESIIASDLIEFLGQAMHGMNF